MEFTYKPVTQQIYTLTKSTVLVPGIVYRFIEPIEFNWYGQIDHYTYFHLDTYWNKIEDRAPDNLVVRYYDSEGLLQDNATSPHGKYARGVGVWMNHIFSHATGSLQYTISPLPPFPTVGL